MNWDAVSAISQGLGSIAVLVTLIYLSTQIREQRGAAQREIASDRWGRLLQLWLHRASNDRFQQIYTRAAQAMSAESTAFVRTLSERAGLEPSEARILFCEANAWWAYRATLASCWVGEWEEGADFWIKVWDGRLGGEILAHPTRFLRRTDQEAARQAFWYSLLVEMRVAHCRD